MADIKSKLSEAGMSRRTVAEQAGLSYTYLSDMLNGRSIPNAVQVEAIRRATGGAVTHDDWVKMYGAK
jgi:DNA-binding transcriptional regulator YdaS (Cro superfamily)